MPLLPWLSPPAQGDLTTVTFTFKVPVAQSRPTLNSTHVLITRPLDWKMKAMIMGLCLQHKGL